MGSFGGGTPAGEEESMTRKTEPRFAIRVDHGLPTEKTLEHPLHIERAERVAARAVSQHGRHETAEILDPVDGTPVISYARLSI